MQGDWIPIRTDIHSVPEVLRLARLTGRPVDEVVGLLVRFWAWAQAHTEDGSLAGVDLEDAASGSHVPSRFLVALCEVHWLVCDPEKGLQVPNFGRWMSRSAKARLREREKKRRQRREPELSRFCPDFVPDLSRCDRDKNGTTRKEKEKEKEFASANSSPPKSPPPARGGTAFDWAAVTFPAGVTDTPELRQAIGEWLEYRRRIGKPYRVAEKQISLLLARYGNSIIEAIRFSMAMGWQGCFPPDKEPTNGRFSAGPGQRHPADVASRGW